MEYEEFHKDVVEFLRKWSLHSMACSTIEDEPRNAYCFILDEEEGKLHVDEYYDADIVDTYEEEVK